MIAQIYKIKSSRQLNMKWWHVEKNTKKKNQINKKMKMNEKEGMIQNWIINGITLDLQKYQFSLILMGVGVGWKGRPLFC